MNKTYLPNSEKLLKLIESLRKKYHYHNEEDNWYSCHAHEDYSGNDERICSCGLLAHNIKVDEVLKIIQDVSGGKWKEM